MRVVSIGDLVTDYYYKDDKLIDEVDNLTDIEFLNKARLTINNKITKP